MDVSAGTVEELLPIYSEPLDRDFAPLMKSRRCLVLDFLDIVNKLNPMQSGQYRSIHTFV